MASTPIPAAAVEPQASISPVGRIVGVVLSPKSTFADIARKPSWLLPVILLAVLGAVVAVALNQKMDWRGYMSQQIEKSPRAGALSAEQKQQQIEAGAKFAPISAYVFGIPAPLVVVLTVAGVMLGNLLFLLVLFLKPAGTFDLENPVATNVAVFLPEGSAKWLEALAKNIDILAIWITLLIAAGFAAANPKRLPGNRSFNIAFGVFAVYIVIRMGLAFVLS